MRPCGWALLWALGLVGLPARVRSQPPPPPDIPEHGSGSGDLGDPLHMTDPTGMFDDGSGDENYGNDEENWIRVSPCEADTVKPCNVLLYFSAWDVDQGDYMFIYDQVERPEYLPPCTNSDSEVVEAESELECVNNGNTWTPGSPNSCVTIAGVEVEPTPASEIGCTSTGNTWRYGVVENEMECMSEAPYDTCLAGFTGTNSGIVLGPAEPVPGEAAPDPLPLLLRSSSPVVWVHWVADPYPGARGGEAAGFMAHYRTDSPHDGRLTALTIEFPVVLEAGERGTGGAQLALTALPCEPPEPCFSTDRLVYTAELPEGGNVRGVPYPYVEPILVPGNPYPATTVLVTAEWPTEIEPPWVPFNVTYPPERNGEQLGGIAVFVNGEPYKAPGSVPECINADGDNIACHQVDLDSGLTLQPLVVSVRAMDQYTYWDYTIMCTPFDADIENITTVGSLELATPPLPPVIVVGLGDGWVAQVDMPDIYTDYVIEAMQGDVLKFNYNPNNPLADGTFLGVRLVDQPGCPMDYEGHSERLDHADDANHETDLYSHGNEFLHDADGANSEGFEIELDTNGTFYIAGKERIHCQLGQRFTLIVTAKVDVQPNTPEEAPLVTERIIRGLDLEVHDRPRVTGTQWDHGVPFYSIAGWDGFHEWFRFDVHQGETTHLAVQFRDDVYFATGMLWDTDLSPLAVLTPTPEADQDGVRGFHFNWLAPRTDVFYVSVRVFIVQDAPFGNYSMAYFSDWEDKCVTQNFQCGDHGDCEVVENPPGVYTPICACRERWKGDNCEIEPPPAVTLRLSATTTIQGATTPENFQNAIAELDEGLDPYMVEILAWPQALTAELELPGSVADFGTGNACDVNTCEKGALQVIQALQALLPDADQDSFAILGVKDYLDYYGLRKARQVVADTVTIQVDGTLSDAAIGAVAPPDDPENPCQPDDARLRYTDGLRNSLSSYTGVEFERIIVGGVSVTGTCDECVCGTGFSQYDPVVITVTFLERATDSTATMVADAVYLLNNDPPDTLNMGSTAGDVAVQLISNLPLIGTCEASMTLAECGAFTAAGADACNANPGCQYSADSVCINFAYQCSLVVRSELEEVSGTGSGIGCDSAGQTGACVYSLHPHAIVPSPATCTGTATDPAATPSCETAFADADPDTTMMACPLGCTYTEEVVVDDDAGRRQLERLSLGDGIGPDVYDETTGRRRMQIPDDVNIQMDYWPDPDHIDCYPYRCYDPTCLDGDTSQWELAAYGSTKYNCGPLSFTDANGDVATTGGLVDNMLALAGGKTKAELCAEDVRTGSPQIIATNGFGPPPGATLADYCPMSCGTCTPYLGGPGAIVEFYLQSEADISGVVMAPDFAQQFAEGLNSAGDFIWGGKDLSAQETTFPVFTFNTVAAYEVTMVKDSEQENAMIANAMDNGLKHDGGMTFARIINATGGVAFGSFTGQVQGESAAARAAAAEAIQMMRASAVQSALAADGDVIPVLWYGTPEDVNSLPGSAITDSNLRPEETAEAQRLAELAAEQLIMSGDGMGANYQTTVERAAAAAEHAAGMVLGLVMTPHDGEGIPDGHQGGSTSTYVHDVHRGGHYQPADFTQYGDFSQAAIAAAASAYAARLVALGADDTAPLTNDQDRFGLDNLDPILSQAPTSQSFSDDPQLPSSTSRFSAQTDYWWIPDYLPGGRPPEQPKPPVITRYTDTIVELSWEAPYDWGIPIRGYEVEWRSCDIFYATQEASECDGYRSGYEHAYPTHYGLHTTHKIMNLDPGKMYFFHVRAFNIFDQYMSPNNYGIWSYDSLAVTLWRVADKMTAPITHEIECHLPHSPIYGEELLPYNLKLYDITTTVENTVPGASIAADADPTTARPNCSIHLSWTTPFSGAVQNPLIDHAEERDSVGGLRNCDADANAGRSHQGKRWGTESCKDGTTPGPAHPYDRKVDIHNNDIINYRIFYHATQTAQPVFPKPDEYYDLNGTLWREIPDPPDLRFCVSDYSQPCPEGWALDDDPSNPSGPQICHVLADDYAGTGNCASPQGFDDLLEVDRIQWEIDCGFLWTQECKVRTEYTVTGLDDSTDYFFIITAINMGGPGAINAPYHPSYGYGPGAIDGGAEVESYASHHGNEREHGPNAVYHGEYSGYTGAGFIRNKPAHVVYTSDSAIGSNTQMIERQYYGEGDFSDSSATSIPGALSKGARVMATMTPELYEQLEELPGYLDNPRAGASQSSTASEGWPSQALPKQYGTLAGHYVTNAPYVAKYPGPDPAIAEAPGYVAPNPEDIPALGSVEGGSLAGHMRQRPSSIDLAFVDPFHKPMAGPNVHHRDLTAWFRTDPCTVWTSTGVLVSAGEGNARCNQLASTGYYPATITAVNPYTLAYEVTYDAYCGEERCIADQAVMTEASIREGRIWPLGQGANPPAATTWRVPDAPARPTFGEITAHEIEVFWKPPPFDGNTNHENFARREGTSPDDCSLGHNLAGTTEYSHCKEVIYPDNTTNTYNSDPMDTSSGGVVRGYRLFMQRYEESTGMKEEYIEIMGVRDIGTNTTFIVRELDADVNYVFTVVAINVVGDSAHSLEAMAPPTMDEPIPDGSVKIKMRPVCPAMQPKRAGLQTPWLVCNNVPTSLFAITGGGGTNVEFDYNIYKDETERKCDPVNCMAETKMINVIIETNIIEKEATCTGTATNTEHVCSSADFSVIADRNVANEEGACTGGTGEGCTFTPSGEALHETLATASNQLEATCSGEADDIAAHGVCADVFEALTPKVGTTEDCTGGTGVGCTYTEAQFEYDMASPSCYGSALNPDHVCEFPENGGTTLQECVGGDGEGCTYSYGVLKHIEEQEVVTKELTEWFITKRKIIMELGGGGHECCMLQQAEDTYVLVQNASNSRGSTTTEQMITIRRCGCMDIFNDQYDHTATHQAPWMCESTPGVHGAVRTDPQHGSSGTGGQDLNGYLTGVDDLLDSTRNQGVPGSPTADIIEGETGESAMFHDTTWAGVERMVRAGEYVQWEQHLTDSVFAVEIAILIESGAVDVYTSTTSRPGADHHGGRPGENVVKADPDVMDHTWQTSAYDVNSREHNIVMWEQRISFADIMVAPGRDADDVHGLSDANHGAGEGARVGGVRGTEYPFIDVPKSLYIGVHGRPAAEPYATFGEDSTNGPYDPADLQNFARYKIRVRNVLFQEERLNLPDWEATDGKVETGLYQFYELYFSESATDMDVKVSVQAKIGNITLYVAKKDKYPSEFRTFTQTATAPQGGLAEVIDTFKPEEDRVLFIAVRGNVGDYLNGYPRYRPYATGQTYDETTETPWNEYIITARSYRYRGEPARLQPVVGQALDDSPFGGAEPVRYSEVPLDNFNWYSVRYSDEAWAIEVFVTVQYGVIDLYSQFDIPPTQARYYQVARGIFRSASFVVPFEAVHYGIDHLYFGVFCRETDYCQYDIQVKELTFADAPHPPVKLRNGTWHYGETNAVGMDGYRFYRSYIGPEDTPMGHTVRSGPGSVTDDLGADPFTWGSDWSEDWVQTWSQHHRDEMDFDVFVKYTVRVYPHPLVWEPPPEEDLVPQEEMYGQFVVSVLEAKFGNTWDAGTSICSDESPSLEVPATDEAGCILSADEELAYDEYSALPFSGIGCATAGGDKVADADDEDTCELTGNLWDADALSCADADGAGVVAADEDECTLTGNVWHPPPGPPGPPPPPIAGGVSIYASLDWKYPTLERSRNWETHAVGDPSSPNETLATLTVPVNTHFGREIHLGIKTEFGTAPYDIEMEYVVQHADSISSPVPKPHAECPAVVITLVNATTNTSCMAADGTELEEDEAEDLEECEETGFTWLSDTCTGVATEVAATCGDGMDAADVACELNAAGDGCEVETGDCAFVAAYTPTCDLDATTDLAFVNGMLGDGAGEGAALCPPGCTAGSNPTCGSGNDADGTACAVNGPGTACAVDSGSCVFAPGTCIERKEYPASSVAENGEETHCEVSAGAGFTYTGSHQCLGSAATVAATCGDGLDAGGLACELNAAGDGCEVEDGTCAFVAAYTPTCDFDETTDPDFVDGVLGDGGGEGAATCPTGCATKVVCESQKVAADADVCLLTGNTWVVTHVPPVLEFIECNNYGVCIDGGCICQEGYYGDDCGTILFSREEAQPRINFISPVMDEIVDRSPVGISFIVHNRRIPNEGHIYLYVDGLPYPSPGNNKLLDTSELNIYGLFRGMHTAQLVLTDVDDTALALDAVYFEVERPGGCKNHCSDHGVCAEYNHGQYCVCDDGWMGTDCSVLNEYDRETEKPRAPPGFKPGAGLVEDLRRQMEHAVQEGLMDADMGADALEQANSANRAEVEAKQRRVELALNSFRNQHEAEMASEARKFQTKLDKIYRDGDRVRMDAEEQREHNRRVRTASMEEHHARQRSLAEAQRRLQNKHSRSLRKHDMKVGLQLDMLEHAKAKAQFQIDHLRHYDVSLNQINDLVQVQCEQDAYGNFECYYENYIKDCVTGDLMMWRSGDEPTPYPVKCPADPGPPPLVRGVAQWEGPVDLLRESSGRVLPVQRGPWLRENADSPLLKAHMEPGHDYEAPGGNMVTAETTDEYGAAFDLSHVEGVGHDGYGTFTRRVDYESPDPMTTRYDPDAFVSSAGRVNWDQEEYSDEGFGPSPTRQPQHPRDGGFMTPPWDDYGDAPGDSGNWRRRMAEQSGAAADSKPPAAAAAGGGGAASGGGGGSSSGSSKRGGRIPGMDHLRAGGGSTPRAGPGSHHRPGGGVGANHHGGGGSDWRRQQQQAAAAAAAGGAAHGGSY
jgi:hypothetical protein